MEKIVFFGATNTLSKKLHFELLNIRAQENAILGKSQSSYLKRFLIGYDFNSNLMLRTKAQVSLIIVIYLKLVLIKKASSMQCDPIARFIRLCGKAVQLIVDCGSDDDVDFPPPVTRLTKSAHAKERVRKHLAIWQRELCVASCTRSV